jgi:hypothetical protein
MKIIYLMLFLVFLSGCSESMIKGEQDKPGPIAVLGAFIMGDTRSNAPLGTIEHNGSIEFKGFGAHTTKKFILKEGNIKFSYVNLGRSQFKAVLMNEFNEEIFEIVNTIDAGEKKVDFYNTKEGYYYIQIITLDAEWEIDLEN